MKSIKKYAGLLPLLAWAIFSIYHFSNMPEDPFRRSHPLLDVMSTITVILLFVVLIVIALLFAVETVKNLSK